MNVEDIKYKAWNKKEKRFLKNVSSIRFENNAVWAVEEYGIHWGYDEVDYFANEVVLLPFTGFQDNEGTEIYEGDLLSDEIDTGKTRLKVQHEKGGGFVLKDRNDEPYHWLDELDLRRFTIIGNVWENLELLKGDV